MKAVKAVNAAKSEEEGRREEERKEREVKMR